MCVKTGLNTLPGTLYVYLDVHALPGTGGSRHRFRIRENADCGAALRPFPHGPGTSPARRRGPARSAIISLLTSPGINPGCRDRRYPVCPFRPMGRSDRRSRGPAPGRQTGCPAVAPGSLKDHHG